MPSSYLDHAASTPMRPSALATMVEVASSAPANPSGQHAAAHDARRRLDGARDAIAEVVGAKPSEVVFTSGGTEADNLAVSGPGGVPACFETDHHAVTEAVRELGGRVLPVWGRPTLSPTQVASDLAVGAAPSVVSICAVNNELGVVQPVAALAEAIRAAVPGVAIHVDAVAAASWLDLAPIWAAADLLTLSGHKVGGPKGTGVLVVREGTALRPAIVGGSQERERRAGTPNVAGAASMAVALAETAEQRVDTVARVRGLRDRLRDAIVTGAGDRAADTLQLVAASAASTEAIAPNVVHLCARGVHREALLLRLDAEGVAASAGSSCASGAPQRSHVVEALCVPVGWREGALRLSLGWCSTDEEVDHAIAVIPRAIRDLAGTAPEGGDEDGVP